MATKGQINTNITYDSYFWVYWEQASQDVAANKTTIYWSCGVTCGHSFYLNAIKMSAVTINGVPVYKGGTYSNFSKGEHRIAYGGLDIQHDADGTKKFSISPFTGWLYSNYNYSSNGGSYELTTIPRQATITAVADFTDIDNPSITFNNPGGFTLDVWLEPNPAGTQLCERKGIPNTGEYTWNLTNLERDQLRNSCPGGECTIRVGLYTHIGDTLHADYRDKKFIMTENDATKPSVAVDIGLPYGNLPSKFDGMGIQGKTRVDANLSAVGQYGSGIQSLYAVVEGKTYYPTSGYVVTDVFKNAGKVDIYAYAKDARGFTGEDSQSVNVIEYSKPLVVPVGSENAILCYRSDGNGKRVGASTSVWIKAGRSYHSVSGVNTCALQWRWKKATEQWDDSKHLWNELRSGTDAADEYNALVAGTFDLKESYTIQIRAVDDIGEQDIKTLEVPTQDVALHLGKGGKNVSVGSYCDYTEDYTFHCEWKALFDNDIVINGIPLAEYIKSVMN